ncbi:GNAT family N-acetyltransferase [Virgibacillus profundi]|uniref:GNAT family N-acetyltransferase n=1 Tax=Virgibacillus profundi TaxID=2024555 RepID=A0A2A2IAA0_9BACI|nr:GNAT family N-acetyltransferase [Virgibacillus profundi]PAV28065.1 GNAT family N-acetyltransferase [Virgibacillus profundi]PXY52369.1 N-acetyltransferase [Virgibacillus profundi]
MATTMIRTLNLNDFSNLESMETGIEDDYVKRIFNRLITGNNRLYGLFSDGQLVSYGGFTIYAKRYAMLGRLRSDRRYRGRNFATTLMSHIMHEAFKLNGIQWVGANTQEDNLATRRILEKLGMKQESVLHGALTKDTKALESGAKPWNKIYDLKRKKDWINEVYVKKTAVFPYECYYPLPASKELFPEDHLLEWSFYENDARTRFLITKKDQKKHHYLHAVYPWSDITKQAGLWETIANDYHQLVEQTADETYIWMDLTKEEVQSLPGDHKFTLPSPWILHGMERKKWKESVKAVASFSTLHH